MSADIMRKYRLKNQAARLVSSALLMASLTTSALGDLTIRRLVTSQDQSYETITYLRGARQRTEMRPYSHSRGKSSGVAIVEQCDLKQLIWIDLINGRFAVQAGGTPAGAVMAFNELQLQTQAPKDRSAFERARNRGVLTGTTTVIDTGERREMFGFTARRLQTITTWEARPKTCNGPGLSAKTDGWYTDLFYGIDCSPDLSGSVTQPNLFGGGKCFSEYSVKRRYLLERKRIGPASLGYPLLETRTSYNDKGEAEVVTEEVLGLSTTSLESALFDVPAGFTEVDFKSENRSFFRRLLSLVGR